jgi:hypothetical protein
MITILIIFITLLIILSIFLFLRGISLVTRQEMLEDIIIKYDEREEETKKLLNLMLQQMRDIDIKGSFESDDEVGSVFTQLKDLIETYNTI